MQKEKKAQKIGLAFLCAGAFVTVSGCATPDLRNKTLLRSMVGQTSVDVLRRFGVPSKKYEAQGHTFLSYSHTRRDYVPSMLGASGNGGYGYGWGPGLGAWGGGTPSLYPTLSCQTTFELVDDRVQRWTLMGDGC